MAKTGKRWMALLKGLPLRSEKKSQIGRLAGGGRETLKGSVCEALLAETLDLAQRS
jgi:hypothetical protein